MRDPPDPTEARIVMRAPGAAHSGRMPVAAADPDDTVRLRRAPIPGGARGLALIAAGVVGGLVLSGAIWALWPASHPAPHPVAAVPVASPPMPAAVPARPVPGPGTAALPAVAPPAVAPAARTASAAAAPRFLVRTATRREILASTPTTIDVFRFAWNPNIIVLDFASLRTQGLMLDRVAALVEKAGMAHDRVVSWRALIVRIHTEDDTIGTYYYGHDYSAAALARFFALAAADHRRLDPEEQTLHALLAQLGWLRPGVHAGLITLPRVGANRYVTRAADDVILTHELSHGEFFSNPAYRAYVYHFWHAGLTAAERAGVRRFLASEEYDITQHEVVVNEMQAYLMFTRNKEFFRAHDIGITPQRRRQLQRAFLAGMPPGWLRGRLAELDAQQAAALSKPGAGARRTR